LAISCASKQPQTVTVASPPPSAAPLQTVSGSLLGPAPSSTTAAPAADSLAIEVRGADVLVAGDVVALADLVTKLKGMREVWMQLHPGQPFPGRCTVTAEKTTPIAVIRQVVQATAIAGFPNVAFAVRREGRGSAARRVRDRRRRACPPQSPNRAQSGVDPW
jgi:hypothetical protein